MTDQRDGDQSQHDNEDKRDGTLEFLRAKGSRQDQGRFLSDARYTSLVRLLRFALPLIALAIVALLFSWPYFQAPDAPMSAKDVSGQSIVQNELLKPRFESRDKKNQPYTITAERAIQNVSDKDVILLEQPMADIALENGDWLAIEAATGMYMQEEQQLMLQGGVRIFHDKGYEMKMAELYVDIEGETVATEKPVNGHGPQGTIRAEGMMMSSTTGVLTFTGPARLVLNRNIKGL